MSDEFFHGRVGYAMSQSARASVVEFCSMLSPPVRVSLRTLQSFCCPRRPLRSSTPGPPPQCFTQRRNLTLYKAATADTVLGQHKLLPFDRYSSPPPSASSHRVNIVKGGIMLAQDSSLQDVYDNYVKPGQFLFLDATIRKSKSTTILTPELALEHRTFGVFEAESIPSNLKNPHDGKGLGALRVTPLLLSSPIPYFQHAMDRSYQFVKHGSPVEFLIRLKHAHVKKDEALFPEHHGDWHWIHDHFPHLRPDFILRSMPEGSRFVVEPVSDGRALQFVIGADKTRHTGPFRHGLTNRLFAVKESVTRSIESGLQAQLPKRFRSKLQRAGNEAYSPMTGLPLKQEEEPEGIPITGERYLPNDVPRARKRVDKLDRIGRLKGPQEQKDYVLRKAKREPRRAGHARGRVMNQDGGEFSIPGYRRGGADSSG